MSRSVFFFLFLSFVNFFSQTVTSDTIAENRSMKDTLSSEDVVNKIEKINKKLIPRPAFNNPTKAGLYSAIFPGLGQFYNKKYWKIPIVWGAVGTGVGIAIWNQNLYKKYREYYIAKLNGTPNAFLEQYPNLDKVALGNAQDRVKRQRDYAIAIASLIYILNIVDAVVDAHLAEGRRDPDLSFAPVMMYDDLGIINVPKTGIRLSYTF